MPVARNRRALPKRLATALVLALGILAVPASAGKHVSYSFDFERPQTSEAFHAADWEPYSAARIAFVTGADRAAIDREHAHSGAQSLKIAFPAGAVGPSSGGHQAAIRLEPATEYCLSYWLRFGEGFSWGGGEQGGKLPGLGQGDLCSGGDSCNGSNGFTARYMWRRDGAAVLYLYHMDKPHRWGEDFPLRPGGHAFHFVPGEWVRLSQRVRINDGSEANGEVQVWVNGREALDLDGLRFVTDGSGIDTFYVSTFHGGNTPEWGPLNDSHLWLDDILISEGGDACRP